MANWAKQQRERVGLPIRKLAEHGIHFLRPDGLSEFHCVGSRAHYPDASAQFGWSEIDTALKVVGAEYGAAGIPIRFRLDGRIAVGTHVQQTQRIGLFNPTAKTFSLLATLPNGLISGDKIIRESGIFREEITLKEDGVREELIVASMPSGGGAGDWLVLETRIQGSDLADGDTAEFSREGYQFPLPNVLDANGKRLPAKRFARKIGAAQYLLTGVPLAALASAIFPVVIDPDFTANTTDTAIEGSSVTYATAHSTAAAFDSTKISNSWIGQNTEYKVLRHVCSMNTSSIGAGSTVTQVNLKALLSNDSSVTDFDINVVDADWSASDPISSGNMDAVYDLVLATATDGLWINTASKSLDLQYTSANLSTSYVKKTAKTYYGLISSRDQAAITPTGNEYAAIYTADNGTPTNRPVLTVVYTTGAAYSFGVVMG